MTTKAVTPSKNPQFLASAATFNIIQPTPVVEYTLVQGQLYALNGGVVLLVTYDEEFVCIVGGHAIDSDGDKVLFELGEMVSDGEHTAREYNAKLQTTGASVQLTVL